MALVTEHQNAGQPQVINFSIDKTILSGKSYVGPDGQTYDFSQANGIFQTNKSFLKALIRITKSGEDYDYNTGVLVAEYNGTALYPRPAYTNFEFAIKYADHLTEGEGQYRVGIYVLDSDQVWNYEYMLIDVYGAEILDEDGSQVYAQAINEFIQSAMGSDGDLNGSSFYEATYSGGNLTLG